MTSGAEGREPGREEEAGCKVYGKSRLTRSEAVAIENAKYLPYSAGSVCVASRNPLDLFLDMPEVVRDERIELVRGLQIPALSSLS